MAPLSAQCGQTQATNSQRFYAFAKVLPLCDPLPVQQILHPAELCWILAEGRRLLVEGHGEVRMHLVAG
jgi:hypothetical protein